ncbi:MAG TPA: hypothetical protein ENK18_18470 [Deltaproteobacteria bacterium]|nr:hypothetical protein [Deltaproteobacteria bacterium]
MRSLLSPLLLLVPLTTTAHPLRSKITDGVLIDVTDDGLGALEGLASEFIPTDFPIDPIEFGDCGSFLATCLYSDDLSPAITIDQLSLVPGQDTLNLDASLQATINTSSSPASLEYKLLGLGETCNIWVDPIQIDISGAIQMALALDPAGLDVDGDGTPDTKRFEVTVPPLTWSWDASGDDINITGCTLDVLLDVLSFFGLDITSLVLDLVEPEIDAIVQDLPAELEPMLEDAVSGFVISEQLDLLGVPMTASVWPEDLAINTNGMRISMASYIDVEASECVASYGINESLITPGAAPTMEHLGGPISDPHVVAMIDDDLVNHLLFAVWSSGLLCFDLADPSLGLDLPIAIDTTLLTLLSPDGFDHLPLDGAPLGLVTVPSKPPVLDMDGPNDVNVVAESLGLQFTTEIEGRRVRLMNVDLAADIGVDLDYNEATGELGILVDVGEGAITSQVTFNEFAPAASDEIASSLSVLIDGLVAPLLGDLTNMIFPIPAIEGLGLTSMTIAPAGSDQDFIGAYTTVGQVPFYSAGCDKKGGCDTSGCDQGCSTGNLPSRLSLLLFPLLVAGLRRRR